RRHTRSKRDWSSDVCSSDLRTLHRVGMITMAKRIRALASQCEGAVMIEFAIIATLLLTVTCGMVDFSLALYQWNAASKAVELGDIGRASCRERGQIWVAWGG